MTDQQPHESENAGRDEASQPLGAFLRRQRELAELTLNYARPAPPAASAVLEAIERDSRLTSRQRAMLADTYRSFVELNQSRQRSTDEGVQE